MPGRLRTELGLFVAAAAVYAAFAGGRLAGPSSHDHYARQAHGWLQGRLDLPERPPHRNDWASYHELALTTGGEVRGIWRTPRRRGEARRFQTLDGRTLLLGAGDIRRTVTRWFVSFPPLPSLLLLPAVAVFGSGVNDVLFTLLVAALNVVLMFRLLRRFAAPDAPLLTALFALGTGHVWCAVLGQVWFTGLIVGVTCGLLFLLAVEADAPFWAGVALAAALATRPHLVLLGLYLPLRRGGSPRRLLVAAIAPAVVACALALYNHLRFDNVFEFGHTYLAAGGIERIVRYGLFNLEYLPRNLVAAFALLPRLTTEAPFVVISRHGMALWLSTPILLWALPGGPGVDPLRRRALMVALVAVAVPPLLYQNTGWTQFGYRFALDWTAPAIVLIVLSGRPLGRLFRIAAGWSVAVAVFGAVVFKRFPAFFDNHFPL